MHNKNMGLLAVILLVAMSVTVKATVFQQMSYQGMLTQSDGKTPVDDGTYSLIFKIYGSQSGTDSLWRENHPSVRVTNGLFNVILGSITTLNLPFDTDYWLGVKVGANPELSPRIKLTSVPYSMNADRLDGKDVADVVQKNEDNTITSSMIQNYTIKTEDVEAGFSAPNSGNSDKVDNMHACLSPAPNCLLPLDGSAKFPISVLYIGSGNGLDADKVDGIHASASPEPNKLLPLGADSRFPPSVIPPVSNADMVDNIHASTIPEANKLIPLGADSKFPSSVIPTVDNADKVDNIHASATPTPGYLYPLDGSSKIPNARLYTGSGNGLNADMVDDIHASTTPEVNKLLRLDGSAKFPNSVLYTGTGNGLDADKVDGFHAYPSASPQANQLLSLGADAKFPPSVIPPVSNADMVDNIHASTSPTANYLYPLDGNAKIPNARFYTGHGNGLDADKLDGNEATAFATSGHNHDATYVNTTGPETVNSSSGSAFTGNASGGSSGSMSGVYGQADNASTGEARGGYFVTGPSGSGTHYGVRAEGQAASAADVFGSSGYARNNSTGTAYGAGGYAQNLSSGQAIGGLFQTSSSGTGHHYGVKAEGYGSSSGQTYGCYGYAENTSTGEAFAGFFHTTPASGTGVRYAILAMGAGNNASAYGGVYGIMSTAVNNSSGPAFGGYFSAYAGGPGVDYGVYAVETAGGSGAAVYAAGDYAGSGGKYAVMKTSQGHRLLSVIESPEVWFEDFGEGRFINGTAHIELDPLFLETVTIDTQHPMKVFIQLTSGEPMPVVVNKGTTGFDVVASDNASSATFDYRIVAKRKGYETERLRETDVGKDDPNLYPELRAEIEKRHQEKLAQMEEERKLREEQRKKMEE